MSKTKELLKKRLWVVLRETCFVHLASRLSRVIERLSFQRAQILERLRAPTGCLCSWCIMRGSDTRTAVLKMRTMVPLSDAVARRVPSSVSARHASVCRPCAATNLMRERLWDAWES